MRCVDRRKVWTPTNTCRSTNKDVMGRRVFVPETVGCVVAPKWDVTTARLGVRCRMYRRIAINQ